MITTYVDVAAMEALASIKLNIDVPGKKDIRVEFIDAAPLTAEID